MLLILLSVLPRARALCVGSGCDVLASAALAFSLMIVSLFCMCCHGTAVRGLHKFPPRDQLWPLLAAALVWFGFAIFTTVRVGVAMTKTERLDLWWLLAAGVVASLVSGGYATWWARRLKENARRNWQAEIGAVGWTDKA